MHGKILIVDDTATHRIVLKVKLAAAFHATSLARSGAEALRTLASEPVDLVLVGTDLPDMPVEQLIRTIRTTAAWSDVPIVLIAGAEDRETRLAAFGAGLDDCLTRPVPDALLMARVRSLLRLRDDGAALALAGAGAGFGGLAQDGASYHPPARVALVAARPETALRWRAALAPHLSDRLDIWTREEVLGSGPASEADLFVLAADLGSPGSGLQMIADLRSRAATREAAVCLVLPPTESELAVAALDLGASGLLPQGFDGAEAAARLRAMLRRKQAGDQRRAALRRGLQMALIDPLTGLHNRRYGLPALGNLCAEAMRRALPAAVMIIDVDRFKSVNDRFGHAAGDAVLTEVARRLSDEAAEGDLLARIGGEEFLLATITPAAEPAMVLADRLCRAVQGRPILLPNGAGEIRVTVSIGLAVVQPQPTPHERIEDILHRADCALLVAKGGGRNQVTVSRSAA